MKKILTVLALLLFVSGARIYAQDNYTYSNAENDDNFNAFATNVSSYKNALLLIVQTYDTRSRQQTIEDIDVAVVDQNNKKNKMKASVKTPYMYVIADYKAFKEKYDFSTSNGQRDMINSYPDTTYKVSVDAKLGEGRRINVFITDMKKVKSQEVGTSFPFSFSAECNTRYADIINNVDYSIDNSGLNDWKDYYTGPKVIKK